MPLVGAALFVAVTGLLAAFVFPGGARRELPAPWALRSLGLVTWLVLEWWSSLRVLVAVPFGARAAGDRRRAAQGRRPRGAAARLSGERRHPAGPRAPAGAGAGGAGAGLLPAALLRQPRPAGRGLPAADRGLVEGPGRPAGGPGRAQHGRAARPAAGGVPAPGRGPGGRGFRAPEGGGGRDARDPPPGHGPEPLRPGPQRPPDAPRQRFPGGAQHQPAAPVDALRRRVLDPRQPGCALDLRAVPAGREPRAALPRPPEHAVLSPGGALHRRAAQDLTSARVASAASTRSDAARAGVDRHPGPAEGQAPGAQPLGLAPHEHRREGLLRVLGAQAGHQGGRVEVGLGDQGEHQHQGVEGRVVEGRPGQVGVGRLHPAALDGGPHVHRVAGRRPGREHGPHARLAARGQGRQAEAAGPRGVGRQHAAQPGDGHHATRLPGEAVRWPKPSSRSKKSSEILGPHQPGLAEGAGEHGVLAAERAGAARGRPAAQLAAAGLQHHQRLSRRHAPGQLQEPAPVAQPLEVRADHPGAQVVAQELEQIELIHVQLVAQQATRATPKRASLRTMSARPEANMPLWPKKLTWPWGSGAWLVIEVVGTVGRAEGADGVRSHHAEGRARGARAARRRAPGPARPRRRRSRPSRDHRPGPAGGRLPQATRHALPRYGHDHRLQLAGHLGQAGPHVVAVQALEGRVDRVDRALVAERAQVADDDVAGLGRRLAGADDGHAPRGEEGAHGRPALSCSRC
ncbi:MAG: hypothetical protein MZV63_37460 [Marinilabiliales bacterium]|nr:hypothetical protein [Marinilabiliales bacterium]